MSTNKSPMLIHDDLHHIFQQILRATDVLGETEAEIRSMGKDRIAFCNGVISEYADLGKRAVDTILAAKGGAQ